MSNICLFTVPASRDVENILDYIADTVGINAAEMFLNKINQKCRTLANFPNMGRIRDELLPSLRSFPIDDYLIFYRSVESGIEILRVVSGYRDLNKLFDELHLPCYVWISKSSGLIPQLTQEIASLTVVFSGDTLNT